MTNATLVSTMQLGWCLTKPPGGAPSFEVSCQTLKLHHHVMHCGQKKQCWKITFRSLTLNDSKLIILINAKCLQRNIAKDDMH